MMPRSVSIIVTTYNWPQALQQVLGAIKAQSSTLPVEVIIADDGSTQETANLIHRLKPTFPYPLHHVWQPDEGFQAAKIRNRALAKAQHDYVLFLDGDCPPLPGFIKNHLKLAEKGWFVFGNRMLLNAKLTQATLQREQAIVQAPFPFWLRARLKGQVNRLLPYLRLPFLNRVRKRRPLKWQGVKTCNLGAWREDLIAVNGLEEAFEGWGYEDTDLILRLQKFGVHCKDGRFAVPVIHLWHQEHDRSAAEANWQRMEATRQSQIFRAMKGVSQYLTSPHIVS